jgi:hypothetical protein
LEIERVSENSGERTRKAENSGEKDEESGKEPGKGIGFRKIGGIQPDAGNENGNDAELE